MHILLDMLRASLRSRIVASLSAAIAVLALPAAAQPGAPFLTTEYRGHTIYLHEDGTWAFADPATTLSRVTPFAEGGCLPAAGGRITYCGLPAGFTADMAVTTGPLEEYSFTNPAAGIGFSLALNKRDGHAGDLAYYEEIAGTGSARGFLQDMVDHLTGAQVTGETAIVRDGIVVLENAYRVETDAGARLADFAMDMTTETETLSIGTHVIGHNSAGVPPDLTETVARLTGSIVIDGTPLPEWKAR